jgi:hypothetical protein
MSNTFSLGDTAFALNDSGTFAVECKIVTILASGCDYVVEPVSDFSLSIHDRIPARRHLFKTQADADAAVEKNLASRKYDRRIDNLTTLITADAKKAQDSLAALNAVIAGTLAASSNTVTGVDWNANPGDAHAKLVDLQWEIERLANSLEKALQAATKIAAE